MLLIFSAVLGNAQQERYTAIEAKLKELSATNPGLNEKVELSVNGVAIQEFIRALAATNNLNMSVDAGLDTKIVNNFSNVNVSDVLLFLVKKYDLDISFIGNIMSVSQYFQPVVLQKPVIKTLKIKYDKPTNVLDLDLTNDSLSAVAKEITRLSQKNVVFASDLSGKMVNGYIQGTSFNSAMDKFAFANDLKITPTNDNFYLIEKIEQPLGNPKNNKSSGSLQNNNLPQTINLTTNGNNLITIDVTNAPIAEILTSASSKLNISYFLFTEPKGNTSVNVTNVSYDDFLNYLFNGTEYTFQKSGGIYLIGERNMEGLRATKVIQLQYRTVEKMIDFIPVELKKGIEVKPFPDQNSLIVSGSQPRIEELEKFLRDVDRVVPVVSIEVIIVDINSSHKVSTGLKAGLGTSPKATGGDVFPGLNLSLGANSINSVIDGINGFGVVNLGHVTPNFYVTLRLLETNGDLDITSTPLLATLNGNEAKMSIGQTIYYQENTINVIANNATTTTTNIVYKPLSAEFAMTINPIVSGDEQITLSISVKKSSFTGQSSGPGSPYNSTSRDFQSLIRVKNQEMIMLGGLDENSKDETSSGVPVLSRIPVIKWFFSSRDKNKAKSKLTIFIKPTVIY